MALTPAEKQRCYRERLKQNPEKYKQAKNKDKERKKTTRKNINELSVRGQRYQRKYWRQKQSECRLRKAQPLVIETTPIQNEQIGSNFSNANVFSVNKKLGRKRVCRN